MQELDKAGFPVDYQSVDRTDEAYLLMVDYIYEGKVKFPYHERFEEEMFGVVHFREKRKVDHLSNGHKDIADSCVGSLYNAVKSDLFQAQLVQRDLDILFDI